MHEYWWWIQFLLYKFYRNIINKKISSAVYNDSEMHNLLVYVQIHIYHLQAVAQVGQTMIIFLSITSKHFWKISVRSSEISLKHNYDRCQNCWCDSNWWSSMPSHAFNSISILIPRALKTWDPVVWVAMMLKFRASKEYYEGVSVSLLFANELCEFYTMFSSGLSQDSSG